MRRHHLTFCTGNLNKLAEVQQILGDAAHIDPTDMDLPEYQGDPTDISAEKCRAAYAKLNRPVLVEDTSLCFNALHGLPGPYIKWFLTKMGVDQLPKLLAAYHDKTAYALCVFSYLDGLTPSPHLFKGITKGRIVDNPRGPRSFGWDCIFEPEEGSGQTYAEMSSEEKNNISHRYRALEKLKAFLERHALEGEQ